jgi:uncharacterized protein YkwD
MVINNYKFCFLFFALMLSSFDFTEQPRLKLQAPCISAEEKKLYDLIMMYRKEKGLAAIPLSSALTSVAQLHVKDLSEHAPYKKQGCNFHSWSHQGTWKACCYDAAHSKPECMWNKPREIANFNADGFEIAYGSESLAFVLDAEKALEAWKSSKGHNPVMINKGIWKDYTWKSIGVGIYKNFACVWFATEADVVMTTSLCE